MKRILIVFSLLTIFSLYCSSSRKVATYYEKTVIINKDTIYSLEFDAKLIKVETVSLSNELLIGMKYNKEIIAKLSDSCELIIGPEANYQIKIENIKYKENNFKLEKAGFLKLHVHSPIRVFGSEPETGKRYKFTLFYTNNNEGIIQFNYLEAREQ